MALTVLQNRKTPGVIGSLELDASISVVHDFANDITQYPVEDGAFVSDHIRQQPERVRITGFVTNSGIYSYGTEAADRLLNLSDREGFVDIRYANLTRRDGRNRVEIAFGKLLEIAGYKLDEGARGPALSTTRDPKLVDVVTGLTVYTSMAVETLSIPRDARTGDAMPFDIELVKVLKVDSETTVIQKAKVSELQGRAPRAKEQAPSTQQAGTQTGNTVPTSVLKQGFNYLAVGRTKL